MELPENVVSITTLRINRNKRKNCECYRFNQYPQYEVDVKNREVVCVLCGTIVDSFEALETISRRYERMEDEVELLLKQARELANYKPWLRAIKEIERNVRSGEMIPCCPKCDESFRLEDLNHYVNRKFEGGGK